MKKTYKRVPFDVKLAKKIQLGEVEGRVVTNDGGLVNILSFSSHIKRYELECPIVAEIKTEETYYIDWYPNSGWHPELAGKKHLFIELPEEAPKTQANLCEEVWIEEQKRKPYIHQLSKLKDYTQELMDVNQSVIGDLNSMIRELTEICKLPEQKHEFKVGDKVSIGNYNEEDVEIYEIVKIRENLAFLNDGSTIPLDGLVLRESKHEFKPFDKVLVREHNSDEWICDHFSHGQNDGVCTYYICSGGEYLQCIPYEGNEHLIGTTNNLE